MIRIAAAGARGRTVRAALAPILPAGPLTIADHGPLGCWLYGDAPVVESVAEAWARGLAGAVRLYTVEAQPVGDEVLLQVRAVVIDAQGSRTALAGATDDDQGPLDGDVAEAAHERLAIALELFEQLHHEDAELFTVPVESVRATSMP